MRRAINHLKKSDPVLAKIIEQVGPFRMTYREPDFSTVVRAIAYQQLSTKAADTIHGRFVALCNGIVTPHVVANLSVGEMRRCGLSRAKVNYIRDLATHVEEGRLDFIAMHKQSDEEVIERMTAVKGIGEWSAQMFLMFALRRENVLPTGDLGIQNAIKRSYKKRKVTPKHIHKLAKPWHPYCSVASWYLWRSLQGSAQI